MIQHKQICVVTGINGATGSIIGKHLLGQGLTVVGTVRPKNSYIQLEAQSSNFHQITLDPLRSASVATAISVIEEKLGPIQVWINVVGGFEMGQLVEDVPPEVWDRLWQLNFLTVLHTSQQILPRFKARSTGRLINFGSAVVAQSMALAGPYLVSKAAVHSLTQTIAAELSGDITCNAILPTIIDTAKNREDLPAADFSTWVTPERIAEQVFTLIGNTQNGQLIQL